jgi:hypothetical protein
VGGRGCNSLAPAVADGVGVGPCLEGNDDRAIGRKLDWATWPVLLGFAKRKEAIRDRRSDSVRWRICGIRSMGKPVGKANRTPLPHCAVSPKPLISFARTSAVRKICRGRGLTLPWPDAAGAASLARKAAVSLGYLGPKRCKVSHLVTVNGPYRSQWAWTMSGMPVSPRWKSVDQHDLIRRADIRPKPVASTRVRS